MFREDLYKRINASEEEVMSVFNTLTSIQQKELLYSFGINSKGHSYAGNKGLLKVLTTKINARYKKNLYEKFSGYSKKSVLNAFNLLKEKSKNTLMKEYTFSYEKEIMDELTTNDKSKIKYYLKCMSESLENKVTNDNKIVYKTFTEVYNISIKEGLKLVMTLDTSDRNLIYKKYGYNLTSNTRKSDLTCIENNRINSVISKKLRRNINKFKNGYKYVSFYDLFKDIPKEELLNRFNELTDFEKNKLTKIFGSELDMLVLMNEEEKERIFNNKMKIKFKLMKKRIRKSFSFKSFYDLFREFQLEGESELEYQERIKNTLLSLNVDQSIVYKKYDKDLKNTEYYGQFTTEDSRYIFRNVYYLMKYFLGKSNNEIKRKKVMERLKKYGTHEEVLTSLCYLSKENLEILQKYYGFTFEKRPNEFEINPNEQLKVKYALEQVRRTIIKEKANKIGIKVGELKRIKKILATDYFKELSKVYDENILFAYFIRLKYPTYSDEIIYNITGVNLNDVKSNLDDIDKKVKKMIIKF